MIIIGIVVVTAIMSTIVSYTCCVAAANTDCALRYK